MQIVTAVEKHVHSQSILSVTSCELKMDSFDWDDNLLDLNLGCQNIFDEISLDFLEGADANLADEFYEPKSKSVVKSSVPP